LIFDWLKIKWWGGGRKRFTQLGEIGCDVGEGEEEEGNPGRLAVAFRTVVGYILASNALECLPLMS